LPIRAIATKQPPAQTIIPIAANAIAPSPLSDNVCYSDNVSYLEQMSPAVLTRSERQERTRAELLAAAARVFARRGYHAASVEEVAAEAGYTTGAVYSNFKGKEQLFLALTDYELEKRVADFRAVAEGAADPTEMEKAASERFAKFIREDPDWPLLYFEFWAYGARNPALREEFTKRRVAIQEVIAKGVERQAAALGVQLPMPAEQIAVGVGALINGLAFERVIDPESVSDDLFGLIVSRLFVGLLSGSANPEAAEEGSGE
jgi:AcrR family transcriptional regulator